MDAGKLASHSRGQVVCEQVGWSFAFTDQNSAREWSFVTSSTVVAEPVADSAEVYKTTKEFVSVEQGQLLRAAEPDQCALKVETQQQRDTVEFTHSLLGEWKSPGDPHRRRQDSDLEDASFDRTVFAAEAGMDKFLVNHYNGAVAVTGPKEVSEYTVRVGWDRLDEWRSGVCSLKCLNETPETTLLNTVDRTRRVKTIPRNMPRYSHDSLGHNESSIKEVEKQIRVFFSHTWRADLKCDSDRHVAWMNTQFTVNAEEQTSFSK